MSPAVSFAVGADDEDVVGGAVVVDPSDPELLVHEASPATNAPTVTTTAIRRTCSPLSTGHEPTGSHGAPRVGDRQCWPDDRTSIVIEVPGGHQADPGTPPFPGGVAVSHLRVYESTSIDGLAGGTPHCHTACTEAYAVVAGSGRVLSLGGDGYRETPVAAGSFAWFTPGTIHRLVNDGGLEILVLMANAGLPEAGDMVITFPDEVLADADRYREAATLPVDARTTASDDEAVRARKDLAVTGMRHLIDGGPAALERFHQRAASLVRPSVPSWRPMWEQGPMAAALATGEQLDALSAGDVGAMASSGIHLLPPPGAERRYGCCGVLGVIQPSSPSSQ